MQYPTDHGSLVFIATAVKKSPIVDGLLGFTCDMAGPGRRVQFHPEARWPKWSCSASRLLEVPAEQFLRLSETAALCESSRKGAQIIGIFAVRKSHGLFSELYCSIPIANRSVRGGCEEPSQIVARHRVLGRDPCCMLVLGDCIFR